jgi:hypothetical protein
MLSHGGEFQGEKSQQNTGNEAKFMTSVRSPFENQLKNF